MSPIISRASTLACAVFICFCLFRPPPRWRVHTSALLHAGFRSITNSRVRHAYLHPGASSDTCFCLCPALHYAGYCSTNSICLRPAFLHAASPTPACDMPTFTPARAVPLASACALPSIRACSVSLAFACALPSYTLVCAASTPSATTDPSTLACAVTLALLVSCLTLACTSSTPAQLLPSSTLAFAASPTPSCGMPTFTLSAWPSSPTPSPPPPTNPLPRF